MPTKTKQKEQLEQITTEDVAQDTFTITVTGFGISTKDLTVKAGTTLGDIVNAEGLQSFEIRLRKKSMPPSTKLESGDLILAVQRIRGGT